ncbi:unnamed protein product [Heterobilharzia americana]|nr:unnamed protein product [Heterobilharzia americana]
MAYNENYRLLLKLPNSVFYGQLLQKPLVLASVFVVMWIFNPITVMHMRTMELARDKLKNHIIHQRRRTHKSLLPAAIRVELTRIACRTTSNWLSVSNWECCQPSWSRTREVLDYIQNSLEKIFSGLSKNNASDECNAISKSEILCTKDHPHSNDHLVIKEYEQVKITSLEGMATNCWLKNCLMNIVSSENYYQPECDKNQSHFDEYVNNNSSTALFNEEKTGYLLKNSSGTCLLSKPHIKLVCGSDVLQSFSVPNLWSDDDLETIVRDYGLICISRPSYDASKVIIESKILNRYKDNIKIVADGCQNSLSSTFVRRALSLGESVRYLVPERALEYIYAHKLYEAKGRTVGVCSQYS